LGKYIFSFLLGGKRGTYDDLFDFDKDRVIPYFDPVKRLIEIIEKEIKE